MQIVAVFVVNVYELLIADGAVAAVEKLGGGRSGRRRRRHRQKENELRFQLQILKAPSFLYCCSFYRIL